MTVGIVEYGIGNTQSISNMLTYLEVPNLIGTTTGQLDSCDALILPGIGAFGSVMHALEGKGFAGFVKDWGLSGKRLIGICAGMQILGLSSEESDGEGLGLVPMSFKKFPKTVGDQRLRFPHIGWNYVELDREAPALSQLPDDSRFYFAHSYHAHDVPEELQLMKCEYGLEFTAAVKSGNVFGFQFHPEKSHRFGMALFTSLFKQIGGNR